MIEDLLAGNPVIPVVVVDSAEDGRHVGEALLEGGISTAEVTFRTPAAEDAIRAMSRIPGLVVGAGTVINVRQVDNAVAAGARYVVSPGFSADIVRHCTTRGIPVLPACTDGSWIMAALDLGVRTVKFFPAEVLGGASAIAALSAPFPGLGFVPTGGVGTANLADYLSLPCVPACGGSWMVPASAIRNGKWNEITRLSREALVIASSVCGNGAQKPAGLDAAGAVRRQSDLRHR
jgi:2-dehydro-3-deoxyphosphogluconate aldolase/(4S)-4-hydroxy-2-oxoglutarate aldolase